MEQVLHGSVRTIEAVRRAIQPSQEILKTLARRHGVNQKTIAKWRKRPSVSDRRTGPEPRSTCFRFNRKQWSLPFAAHLLPLDDCLYALQATIPQLTRSSLHRCLQRHGISRLPDIDGDRPKRKKFKTYPIGIRFPRFDNRVGRTSWSRERMSCRVAPLLNHVLNSLTSEHDACNDQHEEHLLFVRD